MIVFCTFFGSFSKLVLKLVSLLNQKKMNDIKRINDAKAKLQERIDSLNERFVRIQGIPLVSDEKQNNEDGPISISGIMQFFDEKWKDTLTHIQQKNYDEALSAFMANFNEILEQKVDLDELREKSDRIYVDSIIDEMNENVAEMLNDSVHKKYDEIREELQQAEFNIDTISQQFESSIDFLKKDLIRFKKQMDVEEPYITSRITQDPKKRHYQIPQQVKKEQCFPLMVPLTKVSKPHPIREKYRPKSHLISPSLPPVYTQQISNEYVHKILKTPSKYTANTEKNVMARFAAKSTYSTPARSVIRGSF